MDDKHTKAPATKSQSLSNTQPPLAKASSQGQLLLELIALSGEYPAENIHRIIQSPSYAKKVVQALIGDKLIKAVKLEKIKGYRLDKKGKQKLLTENPARFVDYFKGELETNRLRADLKRRQRLHSVAEVYTLLNNVGIRIFRDTKPIVFLRDASAPSQSVNECPENKPAPNVNIPDKTLSPPQPSPATGNRPPVITTPCFYTAKEQKGDNKAIRNSSAAGILLTPTHIYAIYNTGNMETRWRGQVELIFREDVTNYFCRSRLFGQYSSATVGGIMIGERLETLEEYLAVLTIKGAGHSFLAHSYQPFYFITNDDNGEAQLKLLCSNAVKMNALNAAMFMGLNPPDTKYPIEHDALTEDGNPVLFCCLLNIPRLARFKLGITRQKRAGKVIAFDFQREMLGRYLGDKVEIKCLSLEKVLERLYGNSL